MGLQYLISPQVTISDLDLSAKHECTSNLMTPKELLIRISVQNHLGVVYIYIYIHTCIRIYWDNGKENETLIFYRGYIFMPVVSLNPKP